MIALLTLLAGASGAVTRFVLDASIKRRWRSPFPLATVVINVTGSLLLGVLAGAVLFTASPVRGRPWWEPDSAADTRLSAPRASKRCDWSSRAANAGACSTRSVRWCLSVAACAAGFALVWAL